MKKDFPTDGYFDYTLNARKADRELRDSPMGWFYRNRDGKTYIQQLLGLAAFTDYAKKTAPDGIFLDLGTGSGRALKEISNSPYGRDLRVKGSGIIQDEVARANLGKDNYLVTSAANLTNIPDNSVTAMICLNGDINALMSTKFMPAVAERINKVLVAGGAIKFNVNILSDHLSEEENVQRSESLGVFIDLLKKEGFDFAVKEAPNHGPDLRIDLIILGIKKPTEGQQKVEAKSLLNEDFNTLDDQIEFYNLSQNNV